MEEVSYNNLFILMSEDFFKQTKNIAFLVLAFSAVAYVYQYGRSVDQTFPTKTFSVAGEAKIETANDIATFSVSVVTEGDKNISILQQKNTEKMNAINTFLGEKGIEKKDLQTSQYNLSPRYTYSNCVSGEVCRPPMISGYTLTQSLSVKVRNFEYLGDILSGIVEYGANTVSNVSFGVDDMTASRDTARTEAIKQAKEKAKNIALAGGFRVGKLISLDEGNIMNPTPRYEMMKGIASDSNSLDASPVIEPGTQSDIVQVNLTYEIVQ